MEWPVTPGDFVIGNPDSNIAVVTLASDYKSWGLKNCAICGTCFSENFGIEKIIVNVLANPNINCLVICGEESGHLASQSLIALAENGVPTIAGSRKIVGSNASLPYLNKIPMPDVDENSWRKYEQLVKQNIMSRIKKGRIKPALKIDLPSIADFSSMRTFLQERLRF